MSLLIDTDIVTPADLLALDPEVLDVADAEELVLVGPNSILRNSWNECGDALLNAWQAFGGDIIAWPGTLTTYGAFGISRPRLRLNQMVVAAPYSERNSPLHRWMTYHALVAIYEACSNRSDKDRYETKVERFQKRIMKPWHNLTATGLPMVARPLACPGALHEFGSGIFGPGNVSAVNFGSSPAVYVYSVAITWVDQTQYVSPQLASNAESGPSVIVMQEVGIDQVLQVTIAGLSPPSSTSAMLQLGIADGPYITRPASGWNVYVGPVAGTLALQNATPIPVATQSFMLPSAPVPANFAFRQPGSPALGAVLLPGQFPDANYTFQRILQRG